MNSFIDIVFDGPPGPESGRFVEVEDDTGKRIRAGQWLQRPDGYWVLRISSKINHHGALPWKVEEDHIVALGKQDDGGNLVCVAPIGLEESMARWGHNSAFIVKAANNHHDLLGSLQDALSMNLHHKSCSHWLAKAEAAVTRATSLISGNSEGELTGSECGVDGIVRSVILHSDGSKSYRVATPSISEEVERMRICGICNVRDIPYGIDWLYWSKGLPVHSECLSKVLNR